MKKFLLLFAILGCLAAASQPYNNEWITYNRTYYKFKIGPSGLFSAGLYRITQPTLTSLGIGNTPAEEFQLWRNGQQIPIYTSVATGVMGSGDYIEFWGEMANGKPDKYLYKDSNYQFTNHTCLETDSASYFLTVNRSGSNKRFNT